MPRASPERAGRIAISSIPILCPLSRALGSGLPRAAAMQLQQGRVTVVLTPMIKLRFRLVIALALTAVAVAAISPADAVEDKKRPAKHHVKHAGKKKAKAAAVTKPAAAAGVAAVAAGATAKPAAASAAAQRLGGGGAWAASPRGRGGGQPRRENRRQPEKTEPRRRRAEAADGDDHASPGGERRQCGQLCRRLSVEGGERGRPRRWKRQVRAVHEGRQRLGPHLRSRQEHRRGADEGEAGRRQGSAAEGPGDDRCLSLGRLSKGAGADRQGVRRQTVIPISGGCPSESPISLE